MDDRGEIRGIYRKVHLFDLDIPGKARLIESEFSSRGDEVDLIFLKFEVLHLFYFTIF